MERDAHYAAVGIATVVLLAALAVFAMWLARVQFNNEYDLYDVVFYGSVNGLSEGGEVHYNGIRVGEVTKLSIDQRRGDNIVARIRVADNTPVRVTSRAQLEPQGITGMNYIQITAGAPDSPLLKAQYPDNVVPVIQSQPSPIAELLSGSGAVLAQTVDVLNRINRVLSDDNIRSLSVSVKNIEALTTELDKRKAMFAELERAITNANAMVLEYQGLAADTRQIINGDGRQAIANINQATLEAREVMSSVNQTIDGVSSPLDDFARVSLPQLSRTIDDLDGATQSLQGLINEIRTSPRDFLARPQSKEMEVQP